MNTDSHHHHATAEERAARKYAKRDKRKRAKMKVSAGAKKLQAVMKKKTLHH